MSVRDSARLDLNYAADIPLSHDRENGRLDRAVASFLQRKEVDISDEEGDDNSNSEYWEFLHLDKVEAWSIGLVPMTNFMHFQAKF